MDEDILRILFLFMFIWSAVNGASKYILNECFDMSIQNIVDITVAPSSVTTSLYTLANFTCEGTGDILEWTIRSHALNDSSNQDREISVTTNNISVDVWSSVLTIRALPINDGISVGCIVVSFNPSDFKQKGAILILKGV